MFIFRNKSISHKFVSFLLNLAFFSIYLFSFSCATKNQSDPANLKQTVSKTIEKKESTLKKSFLIGIWGTSPNENASFKIQIDTIYYPDADRRLKYTLQDSLFVCFDEKGDTNFICKILKLNKDSLVMKDNGTEEVSAFARQP